MILFLVPLQRLEDVRYIRRSLGVDHYVVFANLFVPCGELLEVLRIVCHQVLPGVDYEFFVEPLVDYLVDEHVACGERRPYISDFADQLDLRLQGVQFSQCFQLVSFEILFCYVVCGEHISGHEHD